MKMKIIIVPVAVTLFFIPTQLYAVPIDKIFTSSGQILDGEEWNNVYIYNDDTIVDMLGGDVDGIGTYDASTVNVSGGHVNTLDAREFSTANISGGFVYGLHSYNNSTINFSDDASAFNLFTVDFGTINMYGGSANGISTYGSSTVNIYGGVVSDCISAPDGTINVFGYDLFKTEIGGNYGYGFLNGYWNNGSSFYIDLLSPETYSNINLIPEPTSLLMLMFGFLFLKRKK